MEFRSSNVAGFVHFQGDLITNVSSNAAGPSSHGIHLTGGSTGGIVQPAGDEANIALNLRGKGTGGVSIGSSAGSTSFVTLVQKYRVDWTLPAVSSAGTAGASVDSTVTMTGLTTSSILVVGQTQIWNSTTDPGIIVTARCSTADELKITTVNTGPSSLSGSTKSFTLLQFGF